MHKITEYRDTASLISYCWYNPQPMRKDHSIAGTTILQTTLEGADNTQFHWWLDKCGGKGGNWTSRRFSVQHHRQSVAMKGKVGLNWEWYEFFIYRKCMTRISAKKEWKPIPLSVETYFSIHGYWLTMVLSTKTSLRRFAAVSPFCFGYPVQPDIASWRIRIIHISIDRRFPRDSTPRPISAQVSSWVEAFFFTPVDFLSVSRRDARAPFERTKDVDFRTVHLSTEWCLKVRTGSGGNVDDVDRSTSRRVGAWSIFWTSPELFSAVVSVVFPFFVLVDLGNEQSFAYYGGGGLHPKTPVGADNVDSSMSIWWVYSQSACQPFFGNVDLQSWVSLSSTYALGEWSVVSHRWSRRTPAGFCIWSNQRGYFTERGRKNWTFPKYELLLHRHEATAPALAKQLYAPFMEDLGFRFKDPEALFFSFWQWACGPVKVCIFFKKPIHLSQARLPWLMNVLWFCQG